MPDSDYLDEIREKVRRKLDSEISSQSEIASPLVSGHFKEFKAEEKEEYALRNFYEKYCEFSGKLMSFVNPSEEMQKSMSVDITIAGLHATPQGIVSASIFTLLMSLLTTLPGFIIGFNDGAFFVISVGVFLSYVCFTYPSYTAGITKIRAEYESILAILYMTIYMRLNPVLENAIYFATEHLDGPLGKDLKRLLWLLDSNEVTTIEEGLNQFMEVWILRNPDFVTSILTLHSVLTQSDKANQERILDKSLNEILNRTYEKMKIYSNDLKTPVTILHTFGMMLPLIGLVAFPMLSIFMADSINISYLFFGYIVVLPSLIIFFTMRILSKRPGAFTAPDLSSNPYLPPEGKYVFSYKKKDYFIPVLPAAVIIGLIIMLPGIYHLFNSTLPAWQLAKSTGTIPSGEYTLVAMFTTTSIPLGLAAGIMIYFYFKSVQKTKIRSTIMEIEDDLGVAMFQMSNQFTENIPIEMAVRNFVNDYRRLNLKKKSIFFFFSEVLDRIQNEGFTFTKAIFDTKEGVLLKYPSALLKEMMWIMVEGAKKGASVLYQLITKISTYLDNAKKIKDLIYDLLQETVSSINIQAKFMAPFLAGLVGSLTLIIIKSLYQMMQKLQDVMKLMNMSGGGSGTDFFADFINFTKVTPPTVFQVLIGVYAIETITLLSILSNGVEFGFDKTSRDMRIAKNLIFGMIVYLVTVVIGAVALSVLVKQGITAGEI